MRKTFVTWYLAGNRWISSDQVWVPGQSDSVDVGDCFKTRTADYEIVDFLENPDSPGYFIANGQRI